MIYTHGIEKTYTPKVKRIIETEQIGDGPSQTRTQHHTEQHTSIATIHRLRTQRRRHRVWGPRFEGAIRKLGTPQLQLLPH